MRKHGLLSALMALALAACGGGDAFQGGAGGGGGGGGTTTQTPAAMTLTASLASIPADGSGSATVKALVVDANNVVVPNVPVTFTANSGALSAGATVTASDGTAQAVLTTGGNSTPRNIVVTAKAATFTSTVTVAVGTAASGTTVSALTLVSSSTTMPSDGSANATIVAIARDANNLFLPGVPVSFSANSGGLQVTQGVTDNSGQAVAILSTAGDSSTRTIGVTATAGGVISTTNVNVAPASSANTIRIGSGTGSAFQPNVVGIAPASIAAGASTSVTLTFVRQDNSLHTSPVTVNLNSPCVAAGTAEFKVGSVVQSSVTTTTGQANITYSAKGCVGADPISATASVGGQNLEASGTVTVAPASVGSITFVSASPANIALQGMGEASRPETSTVIFKVTDAVGGPVPARQVTFALSTTVGGLSLSSPTATSDAQGNVQVVVKAGTVATPVRVFATVVGVTPIIATQSSALTVSTGIPTAGSMSIAVDRHNIEGWNRDGTPATVTVRMADRFSNPVPDGTPVSFQAEGATIDAQCLTTTTPTESGLCSVSFRSSNFRPANGRVSITATAIGEESFNDTNGNGVFDSGTTDSFTDSPEPFLDSNENNARDANEPFYDFFVNQTYDVGNTRFNGVLCVGATCDASKTLGIGARTVVILSSSGALISQTNGTAHAPITLSVNQSTTVDLWIRDTNLNPMAAGTTIAATSSTDKFTVPAPNMDVVPSSTLASNVVTTAANGITIFRYVIAASSVGSGLFTVAVTSPETLVVTRYQISVNVIP
ncbi:MAG: Ig-like domain-containing protein [Steroidobacteraceae bacterium]